MAKVEKAPEIDEKQKEDIIKLIVGDPDIATALLRAASSTAEGRKLLHIQHTEGQPSGEYRRDYNAPELRVFGGTEVRHPEWENGKGAPLPPSYIKRYLREDGTETDYDKPYVERRTKSVPMRDENNRIVVNAEGNQVHTDEVVEVVVDPGAKIVNGKPVKTPQYKRWLDALMACKRLTGDVQSQIRAGFFTADGSPTVTENVSGEPNVNSEAWVEMG